MEAQNYMIRTTPERICCYAKQRIPFQPKGWKRELRDALRQQVRALHALPGHGLYARYSSAYSSFCDVENVLLYNIGASSFANTCQQYLAFERAFALQSMPEMPHQYRYEICVADTDNLLWQPKVTLCTLHDIPIPSLNTSTKPHDVWWAIKTAQGKISRHAVQPYYGHCGISLRLSVPANKAHNIASFLKPLLDGLLCAFHVHEGEFASHVLSRLRALLDAPAAELSAALSDDAQAVLGARNLISSFRSGIKWNPADENCVSVKISLHPHDSNTYTLSGTLDTV
ncbi:hypothetical protein LJC55_02820 [Eubacteriales bacterium OttesenSCG-928-N14]|nr:hypothetical protein [Eubacteriales bacterium OttesenSCG-928-N14]